MNLKMFLMDIGVVVACYLIASIPLASAVQINVIFGGTTYAQTQYSPTAGLNIGSVVYDDEVPQLWRDDKIRVNITLENSTKNAVIDEGYLYACGGLGTKDCIDSATPVHFVSKLKESLRWVDVRDKDSVNLEANPEVARFLIFCRVIENGKPRWSGISYAVKRTSYNVFIGNSYDVQEIDLYAKEYGYIDSIRTFIETIGMVPLNPSWVEKAVFKAVERVYEARSDNPDDFYTSVNDNNEVSALDKDYGFVFPENGEEVFNAITLNRNPSYTCGANGCETALGENSVNCCLDCGCLEGYYCDALGGCRNENLISISTGTQNLYISNCFEDHLINVNVQVNNAPSDMTISGAEYSIGGGEWKATECMHANGEVYSCAVNVKAIPDCGPGSHKITQNSISLTIKYTDRGTDKTKTLFSSLPDIVIGSYTCGNGMCECGLGENWQNCIEDCSYVCGNKIQESDADSCYRSETPETCCYDSGCSFGYCDIERQDAPETGVCRNDPQESDVSVYADSFEFVGHSPSSGQTVNLVVNISNSPSSVSLWNEKCASQCRYNGDYACESSCTIDCRNGYLDKERRVYSAECLMNFRISDYDKINDYTISPVITFTLSYFNGSESVTREMSVNMGDIGVGASSCGDGVCASSIENYAECCYDCGCPQGQYCDAADRERASEGDVCKDLSKINVVFEYIGSRVFDDAARQNTINITAHITSIPSGLSVSPSCVIANGLIKCHAECERTRSENEDFYNMSCKVHIAPIDYKKEGADFYDDNSHSISLENNWFNITLKFNNGSKVGEKKFSRELGNIKMDVIWHCGDEVCQADLGESKENCCVDCDCDDGMFCYRGEDLNGECISRSLIEATVRQIKPSPVKCVIDLANRNLCMFTGSTEAEIVITNPPDDARIIDSRYSIDGMECRDGYNTCPMFCREPDEKGNVVCRFLLPNLKTGSDGTTDLWLNFNFSLQYPAGPSSGDVFTDEFMLRHRLTVRKEYSPELQSCIEKEEEMDRQQSQISGIRGAIIGFLAFVAALTAAMCAACQATDHECHWCCKICHLGLIVLTCVGGTVLGSIGTIMAQTSRMKAGYSAMCRTNGFDSIVGSSSGMGNIGSSIIGAALSAACLIGTLGGGFSKFTGTSLSEIFGGLFGGGSEMPGGGREIPKRNGPSWPI